MKSSLLRLRLGEISVVALVAILAGISTSPAAEINWTGGGLSPPNAPSTLGAKKLIELVRERTNGRIDIKFFDTGQLGDGQKQIEALATGVQELYISGGTAPSSLVPHYGAISAPFTFSNREHFERFIASEMMKELNEELARKHNVRVVAMNWFRMPRYFLHTRHPILSAAEVKDQRVRTPGVPMWIEAYKAIGAIPVKVAYNEQYLAVRQGVVDMTESSGELIYPMKLHEVAPYITNVKFMYPQDSVFLSERAFQALSKEDQAIMRQAAVEAGEYASQMVLDRFETDKKKMVDEGASFYELTPEARAEFESLATAAVPDMVKNGVIKEGWYERIRALK